MSFRLFISLLAWISLFALPAHTEPIPYSNTLTGQIGLNTVPSARMEESGTVSFGIGTSDPYIHGFIGFQIAEPLSLTLRQTSESSSLLDDSRRLYPGLDFKLRLLEEGDHWPSIAVGAQSAFGHKRMAGEYLVASKRYHDFDISAGIGWGRFGSAGHIKNPLDYIHNHFGKRRDLDGENPSDFNDWFTGEDVGFFAGIEYFTPIDGLSVKADWGADRYEAEQTAFDYEAPAPWSASLNYKPVDWANVSLGLQGTEKVMARLSVRENLAAWTGRHSKSTEPPLTNPHRSDVSTIQSVQREARDQGLHVSDMRQNANEASANIKLSSHQSAPYQIGRTVRHIHNNAPTDVETIKLIPRTMGLRIPTVTLLRRDFETALIHGQGSHQEIWHNASFDTEEPSTTSDLESDRVWNLRFILDNDVSLSEDDTGIIYRTALLMEETQEIGQLWGGTLHAGGQLRFNIRDNLQRLQDFRSRSPLPVRSDIDLFTDETFSLDRSYLSYLKTLSPNWHMAISSGLLEEQYNGFGGEVLYRPFEKTYAIGAEAWQVFKRDPAADFNVGVTGDSLLSGHITGYYEIPNTLMTASLSAGRYLAEDIGVTASLERRFKNGSKLRAFVTGTDQSDFDVFGSTTHLYSGLNLSVPIGNIPYIPQGSEIRFDFEPIGRDTGQRLNNPLPLYDVTEPISYRHIMQHWDEVLQ